MKIKTKYASSNVICVFGEYDGILVHLANIDFRTNRIYTTLQGADLVFTYDFLDSHMIMEFDEDQKHIDNCIKQNRAFSKFDVCIDFRRDEVKNILTMCNR